MPAWMRVGYCASSGWRETQVLQQAEKPAPAWHGMGIWASELRLIAAISLSCMPACLPAQCAMHLLTTRSGTRRIGNGNLYTTDKTSPTCCIAYSLQVLPIAHERLRYVHDSVIDEHPSFSTYSPH